MIVDRSRSAANVIVNDGAFGAGTGIYTTPQAGKVFHNAEAHMVLPLMVAMTALCLMRHVKSCFMTKAVNPRSVPLLRIIPL